MTSAESDARSSVLAGHVSIQFSGHSVFPLGDWCNVEVSDLASERTQHYRFFSLHKNLSSSLNTTEHTGSSNTQLEIRMVSSREKM